MQLKALCSFSGPDGDYEKGVIFTASSDDRARWLIDFGYAAPVAPIEPDYPVIKSETENTD